jgi:hypothetical protein
MTDITRELTAAAADLADRPNTTPIADELNSLTVIAATLERLDADARDRVLSYLVARFRQARGAQRPAPSNEELVGKEAGEEVDSSGDSPDIRSFREKKGPASGQEMAAVLAFYLCEALPEGQRRESIGPADIDKYFKQAAFPLPARSRAVLTHAKTAGYLEEAGSRGTYKLSPVGYNLVKYRLPRNADTTGTNRSFRRRSRRGKAPGTAATGNVGLNDE